MLTPIPAIPNKITKIIFAFMGDKIPNLLAVSKPFKTLSTQMSLERKTAYLTRRHLTFWEQRPENINEEVIQAIRDYARSHNANFLDTLTCLRLLGGIDRSELQKADKANDALEIITTEELFKIAKYLDCFKKRYPSLEISLRPTHLKEDFQNATLEVQDAFLEYLRLSTKEDEIMSFFLKDDPERFWLLRFCVRHKFFSQQSIQTIFDDMLQKLNENDMLEVEVVWMSELAALAPEDRARRLVCLLAKSLKGGENDKLDSCCKTILQNRTWSSESINEFLQFFINDVSIDFRFSTPSWVNALLPLLTPDQLFALFSKIAKPYLGVVVSAPQYRLNLIKNIVKLGRLTAENFADFIEKLIWSIESDCSREKLDLLYSMLPFWQSGHIRDFIRRFESQSASQENFIAMAGEFLQQNQDALKKLTAQQRDGLFALAIASLADDVRGIYSRSIELLTELLPVLDDKQIEAVCQTQPEKKLLGIQHSEAVQQFFMALFTHHPNHRTKLELVYQQCLQRLVMKKNLSAMQKMAQLLSHPLQRADNWSGVLQNLVSLIFQQQPNTMVSKEGCLALLELLDAVLTHQPVDAREIDEVLERALSSKTLNAHQAVAIGILVQRASPEKGQKHTADVLAALSKISRLLAIKTLSLMVKKVVAEGKADSNFHQAIFDGLNSLIKEPVTNQEIRNMLLGNFATTYTDFQPIGQAGYNDIWYLMRYIAHQAGLPGNLKRELLSKWLYFTAMTQNNALYPLNKLYSHERIATEDACHYFDVVMGFPGWQNTNPLLANLADLASAIDISRAVRLADDIQNLYRINSAVIQNKHIQACIQALLMREDMPPNWIKTFSVLACNLLERNKAPDSENRLHTALLLAMLAQKLDTEESDKAYDLILQEIPIKKPETSLCLSNLLKHRKLDAGKIQQLCTLFLEKPNAWPSLAILLEYLGDQQKREIFLRLPEIFAKNDQEEVVLFFFCRFLKYSSDALIREYQSIPCEHSNPRWSLALSMLEHWSFIMPEVNDLSEAPTNLAL